METKSVLESSKDQSSKILIIDQEKTLLRLINKAIWNLALEVYRKNRQYTWREAGFKSFNLYCKAVMPYKSKRLFYWCMIVEKVKNYQIAIEDYFDLPIEFLVEAFKLDPRERIIEVLEQSRTLDFTWLRRQVMQAQGKLEDREILHKRVISLNDDQHKTFTDALDLAEKVTGSRNLGDGIEAISQEFVGTYSGIEHDSITDAFKLKILERDDYTCQQCGKRKNLDVHHIIRRSQRPDLVEDEDNAVTTCRDCHDEQDEREQEQIGA